MPLLDVPLCLSYRRSDFTLTFYTTNGHEGNQQLFELMYGTKMASRQCDESNGCLMKDCGQHLLDFELEWCRGAHTWLVQRKLDVVESRQFPEAADLLAEMIAQFNARIRVIENDLRRAKGENSSAKKKPGRGTKGPMLRCASPVYETGNATSATER